MLQSIISILGGVLAAAPLIVAKKPSSKEYFNHLASTYQGWVGAILIFRGVWGLIQSFLHINLIGFSWGLMVAVSIVEFIVGFLLAYSLISKYLLEKNDTAKEKATILKAKLVKYQVPAGIILIVLGIISLFF